MVFVSFSKVCYYRKPWLCFSLVIQKWQLDTMPQLAIVNVFFFLGVQQGQNYTDLQSVRCLTVTLLKHFCSSLTSLPALKLLNLVTLKPEG